MHFSRPITKIMIVEVMKTMYANYWERRVRGYKFFAFCMCFVFFLVAVANYVSFSRVGAVGLLFPIGLAMAATGGICALILIYTIAIAIANRNTESPSIEGSLPNPVACGSCGKPLKKKSRRCEACGYAWCLNCDTWNEPGLERCTKCSFVLPSD
jgi:hypothetical protein